ncbi:MAG: hypothetical protein ABWX94_02850 [Candidatus Saccharimonadales bacterium]
MSEFLDQSALPDNYLVRAHHLKFLVELEAGAGTPAEIAARNTFNADVGWYNPDNLDVLDSQAPMSEIDGQEFMSAYRVDVLGLNKENAARYRRSTQGTLDRYISLEHNARVLIGVNVLDGICVGTAFQRHCRNTCRAKSVTDRPTLELFSNIAERLGRSDQVAASENLISTNGETTKAVVQTLAANVSSLDEALSNMAHTGNPLRKIFS